MSPAASPGKEPRPSGRGGPFLFLVFVAAAARWARTRGGDGSAAGPQGARTQRYCNGPVGLGAEGRPQAAGLELRAVVLAIRHGDRSAINPMPGSPQQSGGEGFACEAEELQDAWDELPRRYRVRGPRKQRIAMPFTEQAKECASGQLTPKGYLQHSALGKHLHGAYQSFLESFSDNGGYLYVRSTYFPRTITSAAALLSALLPPRLWQRRIDIVVNPNKEEEVMHGLGKPRPKAVAKGDYESARPHEGSCPAATRHAAAQFDLWESPKPTMRRVRELFGEGASNRSVTYLTDILQARACHSLPLPCGSGGCADPWLLESLAGSADELYCARFGGAEGGAAASKLVFYPFLREVRGVLEAAAKDKAPPTVALYSAHDDVIAPVLAALDVFGGRVCRWPPYASRIAWELYRDASGQHLLRTLYNGEALRGVAGCSQELCPLEEFSRGVEGLLGGARDWAAACAA